MGKSKKTDSTSSFRTITLSQQKICCSFSPSVTSSNSTAIQSRARAAAPGASDTAFCRSILRRSGWSRRWRTKSDKNTKTRPGSSSAGFSYKHLPFQPPITITVSYFAPQKNKSLITNKLRGMFCSPYGNRTRVTGMKILRPNP